MSKREPDAQNLISAFILDSVPVGRASWLPSSSTMPTFSNQWEWRTQ
jgi:hypothetical protein